MSVLLSPSRMAQSHEPHRILSCESRASRTLYLPVRASPATRKTLAVQYPCQGKDLSARLQQAVLLIEAHLLAPISSALPRSSNAVPISIGAWLMRSSRRIAVMRQGRTLPWCPLESTLTHRRLASRAAQPSRQAQASARRQAVWLLTQIDPSLVAPSLGRSLKPQASLIGRGVSAYPATPETSAI